MTPASIVAHELTGRSVTVSDATNEDAVGIAGRVVEETTNTLVIRGGDGRLGDPTEPTRRVPKRGTTFTFELGDGTRVRVRGERLIARPARRGESGGVSPWV